MGFMCSSARKTRPLKTERLLMGRKESNQTKQDDSWVIQIIIGHKVFRLFANLKDERKRQS